jgi:hypothetical protein
MLRPSLTPPETPVVPAAHLPSVVYARYSISDNGLEERIVTDVYVECTRSTDPVVCYMSRITLNHISYTS